MSRIESRWAEAVASGATLLIAPAVGRQPQHPAHDVVVGAGQVVVRDADLAIGEPSLEQRVLHLDGDAARRHGEQIRKRVQRELEPRHPRQLAVARRDDPFAERREKSSICRSAAAPAVLTPRTTIFPNCLRWISSSVQSEA